MISGMARRDIDLDQLRAIIANAAVKLAPSLHHSKHVCAKLVIFERVSQLHAGWVDHPLLAIRCLDRDHAAAFDARSPEHSGTVEHSAPKDVSDNALNLHQKRSALRWCLCE